MKKLATLGLFLIFIGVLLLKKDALIVYIDTFIKKNTEITIGEVNEYYRDYDFQFVKNTDNFVPLNLQDVLNIYYTAINAGKDDFTFRCTDEYPTCLEDIEDLANNQELLSDINNYVHPYNSFTHIETSYDNLGNVNINIVKAYNEAKIKLINDKVDSLYSQLVVESDTVNNNIKKIHDYIINNSKYDSDRSDNGVVSYDSDTAYGPLFEGYGICGGYTDAMQLFLEKLGIKNFRVSSEDHVWNAVYIDDKWLHLDLTWDDPVVSDGKDYLEHDYFLIDTNKLLSIEKTEHNFNTYSYPELSN